MAFAAFVGLAPLARASQNFRFSAARHRPLPHGWGCPGLARLFAGWWCRHSRGRRDQIPQDAQIVSRPYKQAPGDQRIRPNDVPDVDNGLAMDRLSELLARRETRN